MKSCPVCDTDFPDQHSTCPTDGAVLIDSHELKPGHLVRGKYRIVSKLGQGGMGVVYLADDILLGVRVALKFLIGELGKDPKFIRRFRMEARAAYQLRHPNIVEVTNLDQDESGSLFIAMEFVEGPSLRAVLDRARWGLDIPRALAITRGLACGLGAAHSHGTVHRDIKPENILLSTTPQVPERPKILDFGIVAVAESVTALSMTRGLLLTPDYAAPEQWLEMPAAEMDGRTDLYALGCVFHEMLTGRAPYHAQSTAGWMKQHMEEECRAPSQLRPELNNWPGLDELVLRLLAKNRDDRPADAAELIGLLDALQPLAPVKRQPATIQQPPKRGETLALDAVADAAPLPDPVGEWAKAHPREPVVSEPKPASAGLPGWAWGLLAAVAVLTVYTGGRLLLPASFPSVSPASLHEAAPQQHVQQADAAQAEPLRVAANPTPEPVTTQGAKPSAAVPASITPQAPKPMPAAEIKPTPIADIRPLTPKLTIAQIAEQGMHLYGQQSFAEAAPLLEQACNGNNAEACKDLGNMYHEGHGVGKDSSQAVALYSRSCDAGFAIACNNLGSMYHEGNGVGKDDSRALPLYAKACAAGYAIGCTNEGLLYSTGSGVARDDARAIALYGRACDAGDNGSCTNLGNMYATGRGVTKDYNRSVALYSKACDAGYAAACSNLGNSYHYGYGVGTDVRKARQLLTKGCSMGNMWGCEQLNHFH